MRILLLSDTFSEHTEKWANGLASKGLQVGLFSLNKAAYKWYDNNPGITLLHEPGATINAKKLSTKSGYITNLAELKRIITEFRPDVLHAHYATSYGLLGALSGFRPFVLSVWGSDVYDFPKRSFLHKAILKYNFRKASRILSTSEVMRKEILKYTSKEVAVTPFGVDTDIFSRKGNKDHGQVNIGTIKAIEDKYGIRHIIEAAKLLRDKKPKRKFKFFLIGPGSKIEYFRNQVREEKIEDIVEVTGRIPYPEVSNYHNLLDIFINVSIDDSESFGVAVVEALACETPVIISDVGGLMEVIENGKYGIVVKKESPEGIASAVEKLIDNPELCVELGKKGRQHVIEKYSLDACLNTMVNIYKTALK